MQGVIDKAVAARGERVSLPTGETTCGTIRLGSHVHLEIQVGGVLRASSDPAEYRDGVWIHAQDSTDVSVRGPGQLVGNGPDHFKVDFATVAMWIGERATSGAVRHPVTDNPLRYTFMLQFVNCTHISLANATIEDSQHWTVHFLVVALCA